MPLWPLCLRAGGGPGGGEACFGGGVGFSGCRAAQRVLVTVTLVGFFVFFSCSNLGLPQALGRLGTSHCLASQTWTPCETDPPQQPLPLPVVLRKVKKILPSPVFLSVIKHKFDLVIKSALKAPVFELEFARLTEPFNNLYCKTEHVY